MGIEPTSRTLQVFIAEPWYMCPQNTPGYKPRICSMTLLPQKKKHRCVITPKNAILIHTKIIYPLLPLLLCYIFILSFSTCMYSVHNFDSSSTCFTPQTIAASKPTFLCFIVPPEGFEPPQPKRRIYSPLISPTYRPFDIFVRVEGFEPPMS